MINKILDIIIISLNEIIKKYAKDKDVGIGAKSKNKFWLGYKKNVAVDAQSGMITKVAVTKANVTDRFCFFLAIYLIS